MSIASLVLGIVSLIVLWIPGLGIIAIPTSIVGIVLGVTDKKKLSTTNEPTGMATAGIVTSIIALIFATLFTIACGMCGAACGACFAF